MYVSPPLQHPYLFFIFFHLPYSSFTFSFSFSYIPLAIYFFPCILFSFFLCLHPLSSPPFTIFIVFLTSSLSSLPVLRSQAKVCVLLLLTFHSLPITWFVLAASPSCNLILLSLFSPSHLHHYPFSFLYIPSSVHRLLSLTSPSFTLFPQPHHRPSSPFLSSFLDSSPHPHPPIHPLSSPSIHCCDSLLLPSRIYTLSSPLSILFSVHPFSPPSSSLSYTLFAISPFLSYSLFTTPSLFFLLFLIYCCHLPPFKSSSLFTTPVLFVILLFLILHCYFPLFYPLLSSSSFLSSLYSSFSSPYPQPNAYILPLYPPPYRQQLFFTPSSTSLLYSSSSSSSTQATVDYSGAILEHDEAFRTLFGIPEALHITHLDDIHNVIPSLQLPPLPTSSSSSLPQVCGGVLWFYF